MTAAGPAGDLDAAAVGPEIADDAQLLSVVKKEFFVKLCASNGLPKSGTKAVLLERLQEFAARREAKLEAPNESFFYYDGGNLPKTLIDKAREVADTEAEVGAAETTSSPPLPSPPL